MNAHARQISVILVDDHPVVRAGYRRLLTRADDVDVVGEAADGESGYSYRAAAPAARPATDYTARLMPHHNGVAIPLEAAHILWQR